MTQDKAHPTPPAVPSDLVRRLSKRLQDEASRRNSAYDHYGMDNTPASVDPDVYELLQVVAALAAPVASNTTAEPAPIQSSGVEVESLPELPESVGNGWMDCEDCEGHGIAGEPRYMGTHQPPEYEDCGSCNGSGRWRATFYTADQLRAYALQALSAASQGDRGKT